MNKLLCLLTAGVSCCTFFAGAQEIPDTVSLAPVEIRDSLVRMVPFIAYQVSKNKLQAEPTRDLGDYLRTIPNISGVRKGGSSIDPVLRGFKFSQLNVILDGGVKIENGCPNRMDPVSSHVEAEDIARIEVIKGPFVLKYGPSFGGVINLFTEKPRPFDNFQVHAKGMYGFETNWNGQKEHLTVTGGNRHVYFLLSGGYRNYGNYRGGGPEGQTTYKSAFTKDNYSAKLGISPTSDQSLIFSFSESDGRDVLYPALPMDEKSDDTRILAADYSLANPGHAFRKLDVKIYKSDVDHVMDNSKRAGYDTKQMVADVDAANMGGRVQAEMAFGSRTLTAGLDFEDICKDGTRTMTMQMMGTTSVKRTNLWKEAEIQNAGLFAEYKARLGSFDLNVAVRADLNSAHSGDTLRIVREGTAYFDDLKSQYFNFSGSAGITKKITGGLSLSLALARGTRSPNMLERFIKLMAVGYDNYDYLGNPLLKPETNNEADLTLKYGAGSLGNLYVNGFYSYVQDYISATLLPSSVVTPQTQGVLGVKQFVNADYVSFTGFEFGYTSPANHRLGGSLVAAYTYGNIPSVTRYVITGGQVTGNVALSNDALPEIPPLEATLAVYYKFLKGKLIPKLSLRTVAAQHHVSEAFYEPETPGFALMNLSVVARINRHASLTCGVSNLFDRSYYEHLNRKIIGSTEKLYEPGRVFYVNLYLNI